jgi:hypothetical protein
MPIGDIYQPKDPESLYNKIYLTTPTKEGVVFEDVCRSVSVALLLPEFSKFIIVRKRRSSKNSIFGNGK